MNVVNLQLVPQLGQIFRLFGNELQVRFRLFIYFLVLMELTEFKHFTAEFPCRLGPRFLEDLRLLMETDFFILPPLFQLLLLFFLLPVLFPRYFCLDADRLPLLVHGFNTVRRDVLAQAHFAEDLFCFILNVSNLLKQGILAAMPFL